MSPFLPHTLIEAAAICQPFVVVGVGRVIVTRSAPVGFKRFLYTLVAHESHVEPALGRAHRFGGVKVVLGNVEPVFYGLFFHILIDVKALCVQSYNFFP